MKNEFTNEDRKEAIELLKRFVTFLEEKEESGDYENADDIDIAIDISAALDTIDILEDWMFIK